MAGRGSRPGERRGGRKKGTPNKVTRKRREVAVRALAEGVTPLDVMLQAMREAYAIGGAKAAHPFAKEAAPYVHPRLAALMAKVNQPGNPWEELLKFADGKSRGLPHQHKPSSNERRTS